MAIREISALEFDEVNCVHLSIVPASGDIYVIAYNGPDGGGFVKTVAIRPNGSMSGVIDSLEFETSLAWTVDIIYVRKNIYLIGFQGPDNDGWLKTIRIEDTGAIGATFIDSKEIDTDYGRYFSMLHKGKGVCALAYQRTANRGTLKTIYVGEKGEISSAIDSLDFDVTLGAFPHLIPIASNVYAIAYTGPDSDGWLKTVTIDEDGIIGGAVIDSLEFDDTYCHSPRITYVSGIIYAIAYQGTAIGGGGFIKTVDIADNGTIGSVKSSLEFDTLRGSSPSIVRGTNNIFFIVYSGPSDDGFAKTVKILEKGIISNVIDTLEFDLINCVNPEIVCISNEPREVYAVAYSGSDSDGFLKTIGIPVYCLDIKGLSIPYEDLDRTKELHAILVNLSPTSKDAGAAGEVVIEVGYDLAA